MDESELPHLPPARPGPADQAPLLPDALPTLPPVAPGWATTGAPYTSASVQRERLRGVRWVEFEAPALPDVTPARLAMLSARLLVVVWTLVVFVVAVRARSRITDGGEYRIGDLRLELWGIAVAIAVTVSGWFLSDRTTQGIHLLQVRLPTRTRCVTAWFLPLVWSLLLAVTVLQVGATEVVDVRPVIIGVVFAIAVWRPFSLIRRMIRSLIRVDSDLLVGAAYVLEVAGLGMLWWRLQTLPDVLTDDQRGLTAALIGLAAAAVVAAVLNLGCWVYLLRDIQRAVEHRLIAVRTRHDHLQLRHFGIDPMDPVVRVAMLRLRQEDEEREAAERAPAPKRVVAEVIDAPLFDTTASSPAASGDAAVPVLPARPTSRQVTPVAEPVVDEPVNAEPVDAEPVDAEPVGSAKLRAIESELIEIAEEPTPERSPVDRVADGLDDDRSASVGSDDTDAAVDDSVTASSTDESTETAAASDPDRDSVQVRLAAAAQREVPPADDQHDIITRLSARASALEQLVGELSSVDERRPSILERLAEQGIAAGGPPIPVDTRDVYEEALVDSTDLIVDRMYSLETVRYALLAALLAALGGFAWLLLRSTGVEALVDGQIPVVDIDRIDAARRVAITALGIGLTVVPLWGAATAMWARRAGLEVAGQTRCLVLFGLVFVINVISAAADPGRSTISLLGILCGLGAAMWSIPVMIMVQRQFQRSTTVTAFFPVTLGFVIAASWIAGFQRPVRASDSIETMSFLGGLLVLAVAVVVIVAAISTADVVEAIKLSPRSSSERRAKNTAAPDVEGSQPTR